MIVVISYLKMKEYDKILYKHGFAFFLKLNKQATVAKDEEKQLNCFQFLIIGYL